MMGNDDLTPVAVLPPALLQRRAIVYVRQSTQSQVMTNLESQRRQYDLVSSARTYGFRNVDVIDDDLGISASGSAIRPGFERLVAALCSGEVGAVFCLEVSRLARNGRDWHHVLEICGMVGLAPWSLGGAAAQGVPFESLRAVVGTNGAGASTESYA